MRNADSLVFKAMKALGGQRKAGVIFDVTQQTVSQWVSVGRVPPAHVLAAEKALFEVGSVIDRHDLCPSVFGLRPEIVKSA
ncbi:MAG: helix-turn-helix domain-containing protein [Oleispira sp.]|nr:helix-turn-helix domain-containing protein [Oleispira sp.]MBL4881201.1 helix-turn-helix domain-containing protein [Oleispira sp.]